MTLKNVASIAAAVAAVTLFIGEGQAVAAIGGLAIWTLLFCGAVTLWRWVKAYPARRAAAMEQAHRYWDEQERPRDDDPPGHRPGAETYRGTP